VSGSDYYKVREGDIVTQKGASWEGSLGYLAKPGYIVSNKHVLPDVGARVIHRTEPWKNGVEIGTVVKTVKWRNPSFLDIILYILTGRPLQGNKVDASLVRLDSNISVEQAFNLPAAIVEPKMGARMYKRGRSTGETTGTVTADSVDVWVDMGGGQRLLFTDVYRFDCRTLPGDSGGPNYTSEGIVGITFAGPESGEYGFGIKAKNIAEVFGLG
jgi:S1-C subfamily serine protease